MLPGMGGMDPRSMKRMMQQLGIKSEEISAKRVIIEKENESIVFDDPQITIIEMPGQGKSWQIVGKEKVVAKENAPSEEDVKLVMEQSGKGKEEAEKALKESKGDIAEAILKLKE
ncbi:MAG: nascent polypeptide-associated complex protein [Candidatus Micrarchaeota archaeon]